MTEVINESSCVRCRTCVRDPERTVRVRHLKIVVIGNDEQAEENGNRSLSAGTMPQVLECRDRLCSS